MKILWLSANRLGLELLTESFSVAESHISGILTLAPDSRTIMYDSVSLSAWEKFGKPIHLIERIEESAELIRGIGPDLLVMCGWRQILPKSILQIPQHGVIGFHPTLLPYGRGPAPIINSILHGIRNSGLSMYYLTEGLDDGDIVAQEQFLIEDTDHAEDVYEKVIGAGKKLIHSQLPLLLQGKASRTPQDNSKAHIFSKPTLRDNEIDLSSDSIESASRKIRALSHPYRGAFIREGGKKLVIWRAELAEADK